MIVLFLFVGYNLLFKKNILSFKINQQNSHGHNYSQHRISISHSIFPDRLDVCVHLKFVQANTGYCREEYGEFPATCVDFRINFDRLRDKDVSTGSLWD